MKNKFTKILLGLAAMQFILTAGLFAAPSKSSSEISFVQNLSKALEKGSVDDALLLYEKIPAALSEDVDLLALKGSLLLSCNKDKEAEKLALELLAKEPKNISILSLNAMVAKKKGNSAKQLQYLKQITALEPNNPDANVELASEEALKRNYRNARDYYKRALIAEPDNMEALFGHGKMSYYLERDDDSKKSFNRLLELDPENPQALAYLAKFEAEKRQYKTAIDYVNRALKRDPDNSDLYFDLASYSRFLGRYADAEKYWKKTTELAPDYFLGYVYLAGLYDEQNKIDLAYEYYKKVVEKNPKYYYAYESLGMFAWKQKNWSEARQYFMKARESNNGANNSLYYGLMVAACYQKEKNIPECKKYTEAMMKGMNTKTLDYIFTRLFHDMVGDSTAVLDVQKEQSRKKKGRFLFYLAVFYELKGNDNLAMKYYSEVSDMQGADFFEWRIANWKVNPDL